VEPFLNVEVKERSFDLSDVFAQDERKVKNHLESDDGDDSLLSLVLEPIQSSGGKGIYGHLHQVAQYVLGCDHQITIDLADKFNNTMDGPKTGLIIKPEVRREDMKDWDRILPKWSGRRCNSAPGHNDPPQERRDAALGPYILETQHEFGKKLIDRYKADLEKEQREKHFARDEDLSYRWEEAVSKRTICASQILVIEQHCVSVLKMHEIARSQYHSSKKGDLSAPSQKMPSRPVQSAKEANTEATAITFAEIPQHFKAWILDEAKVSAISGKELGADVKLDAGELDRLNDLLASCLYTRACEIKYSRNLEYERVAFDIAGPQLLRLKAKEKARRLGVDVAVLFKSTADRLKVNRKALPV